MTAIKIDLDHAQHVLDKPIGGVDIGFARQYVEQALALFQKPLKSTTTPDDKPTSDDAEQEGSQE